MPGAQLLLMLAIAAFAPTALEAQTGSSSSTWPSCAHATRNLAFLELYSLEVHLEDCSLLGPEPAESLPAVPVVFRVTVHWDRERPEQLPRIWREELMPVCTEAQERVLRELYESVGKGDVVDVRYDPQDGVQIVAAGRVLLSDPSDVLLRAFVDLWFERSPLAEELARTN